MPQPRTMLGVIIKVGDRLTVHDDRPARCSEVSAVDNETGLVQFRGDTYHWYSTAWHRHIYEDE